MAKRRKSFTIKKIKSTDYIVFRSIKTGKITKWRKGRKFIVEVRDKKTKRRRGFLFAKRDRKSRKPIPRVYTKQQLSLATRLKVKSFQRTGSMSFEISFLKRIIPQFRNEGRYAFKKAIKARDDDGIVIIGLNCDTSQESITVFPVPYGPSMKFDEITQDQAIRLIQKMRSLAIRTSPIKYGSKTDKQKRRQMRRKAKITLFFGGYPNI